MTYFHYRPSSSWWPVPCRRSYNYSSLSIQFHHTPFYSTNSIHPTPTFMLIQHHNISQTYYSRPISSLGIPGQTPPSSIARRKQAPFHPSVIINLLRLDSQDCLKGIQLSLKVLRLLTRRPDTTLQTADDGEELLLLFAREGID